MLPLFERECHGFGRRRCHDVSACSPAGRVALRHMVNVDASVLVAECQKCWLTAGERNTRMKANGTRSGVALRGRARSDVAASPLLSQLACSSGCDGLLLRCKHLGSLLIHLLHSLGSLLQSSGLHGLSGRPLLLHSLSGQCSLLLGCLLLLQDSLNLSGLDCCLLLLELLPSLGLRGLSGRPLLLHSLSGQCSLLLSRLLLLHGSLNLSGLDCRLLLLELLPSLGSGLCFAPVPLPRLVAVPIPVGGPIFAASPIAASTDDHIRSVVARAKVAWRIAIRRVGRARSFWAVVRAIARRLFGAAKKQCR